MIQEQAPQTEITAPEVNPELGKKKASKVKKPKGKKRKIKKRWIILGIIVILIVVMIMRCSASAKQIINQLAYSDTTVLALSDIENAISATGRVESANSETVYSTLNYTVKDVLVEVGDVVAVGDVLCALDPENIQKQINEKEIATDTSQKAGNQTVESAKDNYNNFKEGMETGTNASLISANSTVQNAYDNWQKAERMYNEYRAGLEWGENSAILGQETAMDNAESAMNNAKAARDKAEKIFQVANEKYELDSGNIGEVSVAEAEVLTMQSAVINAQALRDRCQAVYDEAVKASTSDPTVDLSTPLKELTQAQTDLDKKSFDLQTAIQNLEEAKTKEPASKADRETAKAALESAEAAYNNARNSYNNAENAYHAALRNANSTLADYAKNIETAFHAYQTALNSAEAAQVSAQNQLEGYKNSLESARISASTDLSDYQLEEMYETLSDTEVKAPVAGTVTAVYAKVGASGAGLLFVIEDTENLIVETTVKGYDIGTVQAGMTADIKSDATGDEVFAGKISNIAPTANKNAQGKTDMTGDEVYATEVTVVGKGTGLRIGMSVRLNYIVEKQSGVLCVPYDAVYQNAEGKDCVLVAVDQGNGMCILEERQVTTGMENDLDVVVTGEGITEGVRVLNDPSTYWAGQEVSLSEVSTARQQMMGMGMMMG